MGEREKQNTFDVRVLGRRYSVNIDRVLSPHYFRTKIQTVKTICSWSRLTREWCKVSRADKTVLLGKRQVAIFTVKLICLFTRDHWVWDSIYDSGNCKYDVVRERHITYNLFIPFHMRLLYVLHSQIHAQYFDTNPSIIFGSTPPLPSEIWNGIIIFYRNLFRIQNSKRELRGFGFG
jgi:hypothetical protein